MATCMCASPILADEECLKCGRTPIGPAPAPAPVVHWRPVRLGACRIERQGETVVAREHEELVMAVLDYVAVQRLPRGPQGFTRGEVLSAQRVRFCRALAEALRLDGSLAGVSVQRVLELAGASRRAFYECFGDKLDCFLWAHRLAVSTVR